MMPNPWLIVGALTGAILLFVGGFVYGGHVEALKWEAAVAAQKTEAANLLAAETAKVLAREREAQALSDKIETEHLSNAKLHAAKEADLARLADELDRLRRAGRGPGCRAPERKPAQPAAGPADRAAAADLQGSYRELAEIAADADRAAEYARACRAWALSIGGAP